jgi:hypothetical protein
MGQVYKWEGEENGLELAGQKTSKKVVETIRFGWQEYGKHN